MKYTIRYFWPSHSLPEDVILKGVEWDTLKMENRRPDLDLLHVKG